MDILSLLIVFFLIATVIKIATDNVAAVLKPIKDISKFKLIIALALTALTVFGFNMGVFQALDIPSDVSWAWFHLVDLIITILFLTGGAQAIHKLNDAWNNYKKDSDVK